MRIDAAAASGRTRSAVVFLIAGQSNAVGCGVLSPELHARLRNDQNRPLAPDSTAKDAGLPTNADNYSHSYIWVPDDGLRRVNPHENLKPAKPATPGHGMELPVIRELEKRFPQNDIFVIKYGPGATTLHRDWNPAQQDGD